MGVPDLLSFDPPKLDIVQITMVFVTAQRVATVWKDWNQILTQMTRIKVGGTIIFIFYSKKRELPLKVWHFFSPKCTYLNLNYQSILCRAGFVPKSMFTCPAKVIHSKPVDLINDSCVFPGMLTEPWSYHLCSQRVLYLPQMSSFLISRGLLPVGGRMPGCCWYWLGLSLEG